MAQVIAGLAPDILVLSGVDYDPRGHTSAALNALIAAQGYDLPHTFAPTPNAGMPSGVDLNGDGMAHGADDAHGYGAYAGARALLLLSRYPLATDRLRDFTQMLWRDLPGAMLFTGATPEQLAVHRLSSIAHVALPVLLPNGADLWLLAYHAGPPLFGNHPDRNRNRNHDESAFWSHWLSGGSWRINRPLVRLCWQVAATLTRSTGTVCQRRCAAFWPIRDCKTRAPPARAGRRLQMPIISDRQSKIPPRGTKNRAICASAMCYHPRI